MERTQPLVYRYWRGNGESMGMASDSNEVRSVSKDYQYTVDGEKVTLDEIVSRCPLVSRATIGNRVRAGWRTWAELMRAPDKVQ